MEPTDLLLVLSNLSMLLAIHFSIKNSFYLEGWIFFQSMTVSIIYHALDIDNIKDNKRNIWNAFKFVDFYCAILVMITLSVYTAKVPEKYKGIPHIVLGTFSIFMMSLGDWDINDELIIAIVCFSMTLLIFLVRRKCPHFKKKNLAKASIFAIIGVGCFHITYYDDTLPYWIFHTLWHIFIMLSAFYFMRIHPINEIKDIGTKAIHRVTSFESFFKNRPPDINPDEADTKEFL